MPRAALALLLIPLFACSPAEMCRNEALREMRVLDRQIRESEQEIARGYRLVEVRDPFAIGLTLCVDPTRHSRFCARDDGPEYRRVEINIPAERAKLVSLRSQRPDLERRTQAAIAACPAE